MNATKTYEIHGCFVELSRGKQTAIVRRLEIKDGLGHVLQSAAEKQFETRVEGKGATEVTITAQEQAHLWARDLPSLTDEPDTDLDQ